MPALHALRVAYDGETDEPTNPQCSILPALAFSLDMFSKTDMSFGVNEVLLSSVLGSVVFSIFAAQPLVIVGVTGPITVFNYTVYDIITPRGTNYFSFMCWIGLYTTDPPPGGRQ
ncbi:MAG: anion exchange family [Lasallia pustulata]|uniref:Anion exchange family n=1 Tax=Lasallia pustulata TaxID=136370 RepID=A0A5M8PFW5_9LECA|nr:MAG: anion exchange family [Lasallia pustulata]